MSTKHIVKRGESLSSIALDYYGDWKKYPLIKNANNLKSDTIITGQTLIIPDRLTSSDYMDIGRQLEKCLEDIRNLPSVQKLAEMLGDNE